MGWSMSDSAGTSIASKHGELSGVACRAAQKQSRMIP